MLFKKSKKMVRKSKKIVRKGKRKNTTRKLMKKTIKRGGGQGSSSLAPPSKASSKVSSKASSKVSSKGKKKSMSPIPELSTIKSVSPVSDILPIDNSTIIPDLSSIEKIEPFGPPSNNGFIHMIETNNGMNAILKSSQTLEQQEGYLMKPDNLMYEYLVGQYINRLNVRFPCFLQTYGLYKYSNDLTYQKLMRSKNPSDVTSDDVKNIEKVSVNYKNLSETLNIACRNDQHMAILLQYLPNIESISSMLEKNKLTERDIITSLYQIYFVLNVLKNEFTHYDLHARNVQLYEVPEGNYIQYQYHSLSGIVSFKSKYLVKIIDYSRCFFIKDKSFSSIIVKRELNDAKGCITYEESDRDRPKPAGIDYGFQWLTQEAPPKNKEEEEEQHFINSTLLNMSHDLRLLQDIKTQLESKDKIKQTSSLNKFLNHVYYKNKFGTPNQNKSIEGKKIVNVSNAEGGLNNIITKHEKYNQVPPETSVLLCTLNIYSDGRDMKMTLSA